jgi:hypothetical protein
MRNRFEFVVRPTDGSGRFYFILYLYLDTKASRQQRWLPLVIEVILGEVMATMVTMGLKLLLTIIIADDGLNLD